MVYTLSFGFEESLLEFITAVDSSEVVWYPLSTFEDNRRKERKKDNRL